MGISYRKLRILLAERNIKPTDIVKNTSISWTSMTKINNDQSVNLSTLEEICKFLKCDFGDIVEYVDDSTEK
jgi:DNA-binding Xre family transcriptional regulator